MKKFLLTLLLCLLLCLTGCDSFFNDITTDDKDKTEELDNKDSKNQDNQEDKKDSKDQDNQEDGEEDKLELEKNTPQSWIDLFTFDNVTIFLKNNLTIKKGDTYKCINGSWYKKYQSATEYESHNGRYIFDLYLTHYSIFTFNEEGSYYEAHGVKFDTSGYEHDIIISINDNKIVQIYDECSQNTSVIWTQIDFSNYGATTLDE